MYLTCSADTRVCRCFGLFSKCSANRSQKSSDMYRVIWKLERGMSGILDQPTVSLSCPVSSPPFT